MLWWWVTCGVVLVRLGVGIPVRVIPELALRLTVLTYRRLGHSLLDPILEAVDPH